MTGPDDERTVEVSLSAETADRLETMDAGDRAAVVEEAVETELRIREYARAVEERRAGRAESVEPPSPGPLASPVGALLGFELVEMGDGEAVLSMAADSRHANRGGAVQGGVLTALADTATAFAFMTTLDEDASTTNIELSINFLRPVFEDRLEARATVVHRGRTIGLVECDVETADGRLIARMSTTYMVLRDDRAEGR